MKTILKIESLKNTKKRLLAFSVLLMIFAILSFGYYGVVVKSSGNFNGVTIVLDAGHGGKDGGSIGVNGTIEKEINLDYVLLLKDKLVKSGYKVVLTRKNDDGLYSAFAKNKKVSDMNERMKIIKQANPNLVVSIHMNSFSDHGVKGANTYHKIDDTASTICGDYIQGALNDCGVASNRLSKDGDFFMLNCSYYSSILIECGFLSNAEEEKLLNTNEHKEKIINAIYNGILLYFGNYAKI